MCNALIINFILCGIYGNRDLKMGNSIFRIVSKKKMTLLVFFVSYIAGNIFSSSSISRSKPWDYLVFLCKRHLKSILQLSILVSQSVKLNNRRVQRETFPKSCACASSLIFKNFFFLKLIFLSEEITTIRKKSSHFLKVRQK